MGELIVLQTDDSCTELDHSKFNRVQLVPANFNKVFVTALLT